MKKSIKELAGEKWPEHIPTLCSHAWQENIDTGGNFCVKCGEKFNENKSDTYDYVKQIIDNYQPHAARIMINGYVIRDVDVVDLIRKISQISVEVNECRHEVLDEDVVLAKCTKICGCQQCITCKDISKDICSTFKPSQFQKLDQEEVYSAMINSLTKDEKGKRICLLIGMRDLVKICEHFKEVICSTFKPPEAVRVLSENNKENTMDKTNTLTEADLFNGLHNTRLSNGEFMSQKDAEILAQALIEWKPLPSPENHKHLC